MKLIYVPNNFESKRVLIVEDERSIRETLADFLSDEGFTVAAVENGQQALDFLRAAETLPSLILLDLMMPVKDGIEFRYEQLADPELENIPVLLMSADTQMDRKAELVQIQDRLRKPLDIVRLLDSVRRLCA